MNNTLLQNYFLNRHLYPKGITRFKLFDHTYCFDTETELVHMKFRPWQSRIKPSWKSRVFKKLKKKNFIKTPLKSVISEKGQAVWMKEFFFKNESLNPLYTFQINLLKKQKRISKAGDVLRQLKISLTKNKLKFLIIFSSARSGYKCYAFGIIVFLHRYTFYCYTKSLKGRLKQIKGSTNFKNSGRLRVLPFRMIKYKITFVKKPRRRKLILKKTVRKNPFKNSLRFFFS